MEKGEITLVSAFYEIKSKFPSNTYYEWMRNYLSLSTQMVIFTDSKSESYIKELRANNQNKTVIIIQELMDTKMYKNIEYWNYCYEIDTEKYHNPLLYLIWAQKTFFVETVIEKNPFESSYFFWCDIGAFRNVNHMSKLIKFPNIEKVSKLPENKIVLFSIEPFQSSDRMLNINGIPCLYDNVNGQACSKDICRVQGGFFGGSKNAWSSWINLYSITLEKFMVTKTFGGKDQAIMSTIALLYPHKVHIIQTQNRIDNDFIDKWFYFQYILS